MRSDCRGDRTFGHSDCILVFMTARTGYDFAGHTRQPASHPLDGSSVFVQRLDRNRRIGRYLEHDGTVLFDRNRTEDTFDIPSALDTLRIVVGRSEDISIFVGKDTKRFDCSAGYSLRSFPFINVLNEYGSLFFSRFDLGRDDRGHFRFLQRNRGGEAFAFLFGYQGQVIEYVHQIDSPKCIGSRFTSYQEIFFIQWIRLHELGPNAFYEFILDDRDDGTFAER